MDLKIRKLADLLHASLDKNILLPTEENLKNEFFPREGIKTDYAPLSSAWPLRLSPYHEMGLSVIAAYSPQADIYTLMICRIQDVASAIMFSNTLVRLVTRKDSTTLEIPKETDSDLNLEYTDPEFFPSRFLVADTGDFKLTDTGGLNVKFLVASDDLVEGKLHGTALLKAIQDRTPWGVSPPGIQQPELVKASTGAKSKTQLRKK